MRRRRLSLEGPSRTLAVGTLARPGTTPARIRLACDWVLRSDGAFAILGSIADPQFYVQWIEHNDEIWIEISDPAYNDLDPLNAEQLVTIEELGFEKDGVNFGRDVPEDLLDAASLADYALGCFEEVFGIGDPALLELRTGS